MRILAAISMLLCFLSLLVAIWMPGVALRGGISASLFLVIAFVLYALSDPELKGME